MKLCFSTLGCTNYTLGEAIALAKNHKMDAIEIRGLSGILDNEKIPFFSEEESENTKNLLAEAGVSPLVLGTSATFHDPEKYEAAITEGLAALKIASRIGFSAIRVFGDRITGDEAECLARISEGILTLCKEAEALGVQVFLEVHGEINTIERIEKIVAACEKSPCFALLWDVCHTRKTCAPKAFYERFAPYIRHVHFKDILGDTHVLPGDGELPLCEITEMMTKGGYDGYFSLEWERKWHPELAPIEEALEKYTEILK